MSAAGAADSATWAKLRLPHLLGQVSFEVHAAPPAAVLVVRRLADPLPRAFDAGALRVPPAWERAARAALDRCYRRAVRPGPGDGAERADAVVFDDISELLAAFGRDCADGSFSGRWWWRAILRGAGATWPHGLFTYWAQHPQHLPAALARLMADGHAAAVVRRLTPDEAARLFDLVAEAYELPVSAFARAATSAARAEAPVAAGDDGARTVAEEERVRPGGPDHEWAGAPSLLPELPRLTLDATLAPEHRLLLLAAAALRRPLLASRPAALAAALARRLARERAATAVASIGRDAPDTTAPPPADASARSELAAPVAPVRGQTGAPARAARATVIVPARGGDGDVHGAAGPAGAPALAAATAESAPAAAPGPAGVATELGGVLFLVNVIRSMDLVRLLENHFDVRCAFGPWGWVELLGRALLGAARAQHAADPIWRLLAELDGRSADEPLDGSFSGQPVYRLPDVWRADLDGEPAGPLRARLSRRGWQLWGPAGVLLLDRARDRARDDARDLRAGLRADADLVAPRCEIVGGRRRTGRPLVFGYDERATPLGPELDRFARFVLSFVRWRLGHALGVRPRAVARRLLCRPAMVHAAPSHVDALMSLNQVTLSVRLAGLDADPGFAPSFGRVIHFHYS